MRIVITSVTTAQSIITNWNKSAYVTIGTSSFLFASPALTQPPFGSPGKPIKLAIEDFLIRTL